MLGKHVFIFACPLSEHCKQFGVSSFCRNLGIWFLLSFHGRNFVGVCEKQVSHCRKRKVYLSFSLNR